MATTLAGNPGTVHDASEGEKFSADTTLTCVTCATCGILYAIPDSLKRSALKYRGDTRNGWKLCCPLGHTWWYVGQTEEERERNRAEYLRDQLARERARHDQTEASRRAEKAAKTRIRNDRDRLKRFVVAGQCPVKGCKRHFKNVAAHIERQHPDFADHEHGE